MSKAQLCTLAESTAKTYLDRVVKQLLIDFPIELDALSGNELRYQVETALARFRSQDFRRGEYLYRLIALELFFGPQFEKRLPMETRLLAFPPPGAPLQPEVERFWAIYRAAEHLK